MEFQSLNDNVQFLQGVGPDRAALLKRLGIETLEDLLWYLPRDILDYSHVRPVAQLQEKEAATVRGVVRDLDARSLRGNRIMTVALLDCGNDFVRGVWFNQPWMIKRLAHGQSVLFSGKPKQRDGRWEFSHPEVQILDDDDEEAGSLILTRYRLTEGLQARDLRKILATAVSVGTPLIADPLPAPLLERLQFPALSAALRGVHLPRSAAEFHSCRRRLLFDDLFEFQLGIALRRRAWKREPAAAVFHRTAKIDARIRRLFPFSYTPGQNQAVQEIAGDLASGSAMHRLLQADVGAGKTVVAIDTMLTAVAHGWQAVLMAPTELLAQQHWQTIDEILSSSRVQRGLLTGSLSAIARRSLLESLADGSLQLVVGTQALIQADVRFQKLGVVVIDEQHKFGVAQRARFTSQHQPPPHVLVMTATPIPRTLCLSQFGDLDLTLVKDRPQGRRSVFTRQVTGPAERRKAWKFLLEQIDSGRQLYVVCPLVDAGEGAALGVTAAEQVYRELTERELAKSRVGLVHGRMDREARAETMERFRERELDALIATTVIEVGVDVPNATLMVVLDAERFGLSQLHQLRGRVARGKFRGYCFLFSESTSPDARARLEVLEQTEDGFEVAEQDFALRGPGDILGTRQHGELPLRYPAQLHAVELLEQARNEAFQQVQSGAFDQPEFAALKRRVLDRFSQLMDLPRSG